MKHDFAKHYYLVNFVLKQFKYLYHNAILGGKKEEEEEENRDRARYLAKMSTSVFRSLNNSVRNGISSSISCFKPFKY